MTRTLTVQDETEQEIVRRPAAPAVPPSLSLAQSVGNQAFGAILRSVRSDTVAPLASARVARLNDSVLSRGLAQAAQHRNADARSAGGEVATEDELVDARSVGGDVAAEDDLVDARGGMLMRNGPDGGTGTVTPGTDAGAPSRGSGAGGTAALAVTLPPTVRFPGTPAGMPDRIPPNKDFAVAVGIAGWSTPMAPVTVTVEGSGAANGTATINGAASADLTAGATVQLRGTAQTAPGNGGHLRIVARLGTTVLASSAMFTVAAIPLDWNDVLLRSLTGARRGIVVQDSWKSDSGSVADLNETEIAEEVEITTASGCFSGLGGVTSGFLAGDTFSTDTHSSPTSALTSAGVRIAQQTSKFNDRRTGATNVPMPTSGMRITRTVRATAPSGFEIETTKIAAATTANGVASAAGSGSATATQPV